jgi:hypothetical protein
LRAKNQIESQKEHEEALKEEKGRHNKAIEEHETRLSDMKRSHEKQCEELGRELLKQKLEADRLFNELTSKGIDVPRRALFKEETKSLKKATFGRFVMNTLLLLLAVVVTWGYQNDVFTKSGICAPVMPGTELDLDTKDATFLSPWWAPESFKQEAFAKLCADKRVKEAKPSSVAWTKDGKINKFTLTIGGRDVLKKKVVKAEILSNKIRLWRKNGLAEETEPLW